MDLAELNLKIDATDVTHTNRELITFEKRARGAERAASALNRALAAMAAAAAAFVAVAVREFSKLERVEASLEALTGSASESRRILAELEDFARSAPISFDSLQTAASNMVSFGFATSDVVDRVKTLAEASATLGGNANEGILRFTRALGEIRSQGKLDNEDLRRLAELRVPNLVPRLAETFGFGSSGEFRKAVEKGAIEAGQAIEAVFGILGERRGFLSKIGETISGGFEVALNNVREQLRGVGAAFAEAFQIRGFTQEFIGAVQDLGPRLQRIVRILFDVAKEGDRADDVAVRFAKALEFVGKAAAALVAVKLAFWLVGVANGVRGLIIAVSSIHPLMLALAAASIAASVALGRFTDAVKESSDESVTTVDVIIAAFQAMKDRVLAVANLIGTVWSEFVWPEIQRFLNSLRVAWDAVWSVVGNRVLDVYRKIVEFAKTAINRTIATVLSGVQTIRAIVEALPKVFDYVWDRFAVGARDAVLAALASVRSFAAALSSFAPELARTIQYGVDGVTIGIRGATSEAAKNIADNETYFAGVFQKLASSWSANFQRDFVGEAVKGVEKFGESFRIAFEATISALESNPAIKAALDRLRETFGEDFFDDVRMRAEARARARSERPDLSLGAAGQSDSNSNREIDALAERMNEFFLDVEQGIRDGVVSGLEAAIFSEDWRQALSDAFRSLTRTSLEFGMQEAFGALTGKQPGSGESLLGSLFGIGGAAAAGAGGAAAGGAGALAPSTPPAPAGYVGKGGDIVVLNVPDQATADTLAGKMSSRAAAIAVANGSGSPGVTSGKIKPGRKP